MRPALALTPGEPAGIGPDLALALAPPHDHDRILIADPQLLAKRAGALGLRFEPRPWPGHGAAQPASYVLPLATAAPVRAGQLDPANSQYVIDCLRHAAHGCLRREFQALVTGPVHKGVINDAGIAFSGHTEFLAAAAGVDQVVMMLAAPDLRVALATTHLPLAAVSAAITRAHLTGVLRILHRDLREKFAIPAPRIRVCGLNPHAGEGGPLGARKSR